MKFRLNILYAFLTLFLTGVTTYNLFGQCLGPVNNGDPFMLPLEMDGMESFTLNGLIVTISYDDTDDKIYLDVSGGTQIYTDGMNNVVNVDPGIDITAIPDGSYTDPLSCLFNVGTNQGQFGGGTDGYVALKNGDEYGWLYLDMCGVTTCDDYWFAVVERRFDMVPEEEVITGDCDFTPIPTLSQWAIITLGFGLFIIGVLGIRQVNYKVAAN